MKTVKVTIARIYITEASGLLKEIVKYLHDEAKIRGVSVFRAISGYGDSGATHDALLVDLSLDLPLAIEFFDHTEKMTKTLEHINLMVKPEHIIFWEAQANEID